MKVGRAALDDESVKLIQATHPDIEFDWPMILKGRPESTAAERPRTEPSSRSERGGGGRPAERPEKRGRPDGPRRPDRRAVSAEPAPRPAAPQAPPPVAEIEPAPEAGPAAVRLGPAGVARLRSRYAEIAARIQTRVEDDGRRAELNQLAARLNPDDWATDEAVVAGLEGYEATYEQLKNAIGGRRRTPAAGDTVTPEGPAAEAPAPSDQPE